VSTHALPASSATLSVESGDDLQAWRRLGRATLADLAHGETRIEQNRVALDGAVGDYLRLTWSDLPEGWRLHSLVGIRRDDGPAETRDWLDLEAAVVEKNGRRRRDRAAARLAAGTAAVPGAGRGAVRTGQRPRARSDRGFFLRSTGWSAGWRCRCCGRCGRRSP
jgi:hypothetical protein